MSFTTVLISFMKYLGFLPVSFLWELISREIIRPSSHAEHMQPHKHDIAMYATPKVLMTMDVEKLQFSLFLISCSQGILNTSWLSWSLVLKIGCLHVSFTAYENFYKLSKMHCLLVLTFHFPIFRMSEYRNPTIKHISTYTLISPFISTYVTDLFLVILFT